MDITRGDVVLAVGPVEHANGPRPFVVVQSDVFNGAHASFSLCPITSFVDGNHLFRVPLSLDGDTGLDRDSEVQIDKIQSFRRTRILRVLGAVPLNAMTQVDDALRRWLQL